MSGKSYKVTDNILAKYNQYIDQGLSKAESCRRVGIAQTTMSDHIKRLAATSKVYSYAIMKRSGVLSIVMGENFYNISNDSILFEKNKDLIMSLLNRDTYTLNQSEYNILIGPVDYSAPLKECTAINNGPISKNGKYYYKDIEVSPDLYEILADAYKNKKKSIKSIIKFADMLVQNPDKDVIRQLYSFMRHNDITINSDGYVIAYKAVNMNYKDHRTNKFDNSIGSIVTEDRAIMDTNPNNTCSRGLHVGSQSYIHKYYSTNSRLLACLVHPKDFVCVPTDYNGGKARVCEYKVINEVDIQ